jgi:hypothetical protein
VEHEEGADDEFGRRDVLTGEQTGEFPPGLELVGRDRLPVELVELVHGRGQLGDAFRHAVLLPGPYTTIGAGPENGPRFGL